MWIKVRHNYGGTNKGKWHYVEIQDESQIEEAIRNYEYTVDSYWVYRSIYQGAEHEIIDRPPKEWLEARCKKMRATISELETVIKNYEEI